MKKGILLLVMCLFQSAVFAQTGKITGTVVDENGETVVGASVYVEGIEKGKTTGIDGDFLYTLAAGKYTITVKFVAYQDYKISGVEVLANENTPIVVKLVPKDGSEIPPVEIVFIRDPGGDPAADDARKESGNAQDSYTKDAIARSPATTASDAIKKVTGVTIQDNKFAVIRGMGDRYNAAYINGAPLPSSEADRKAISFEIFPANLIERITVVKTATPNTPGEFAGGVLSIDTRSIPQENSHLFTFGGGYNSTATFKDFKTYEGGKTDWLGLDDGTRQIPEGVPGTDELRDAKMVDRGNFAKLFESNWKIDNIKAKPNMSAQYIMGLSDTLFGNAAGMIFAMNYGSSNSFTDIYRQEYEEQAMEVIKRDSLHDQSYSNNIVASTLLNFACKFTDKKDVVKHTLKFNNIYGINSEDKVTIRSGARELDQTEKQWEKGSVRWFTQNNMYSGQLAGSHSLGRVKAEWNGGYSNVNREIPNMRRIIYQKTSAIESDSLPYFAVIDANNSRAGGIMFFSKMQEEIYSAKTDITIPFDFSGKYKQSTKQLPAPEETDTLKKSKFGFSLGLGGLYQYRDRTFSARNIGFDKYKIGTSVKFDSELLLLDETTIFSSPYLGQMKDSAAPYSGGFTVKETTRSTDSYVAHSELKAGYGMVDMKIGRHMRFITGARLESYNQFLETELNGEPLITDTTVNDILPSANLIYSIDFSKKDSLTKGTKISTLIFRGAYFRTVSRPEFRELAIFNFYDFVTDFELYGNPQLQRGIIDNYDFRVEYFPSPGQVLSGSAFYKKITNATELANRPDVLRTLYYTNVDLAINKGIELEYRVNLGLFTGPKHDTLEFVQNTSFFANFAYIKSEVHVESVIGATSKVRPLQGQSPYLINAGLTTFIPFLRLNTTISYNVFGPRLYIVGSVSEPDYWENPRHIIDWQISREFKKKPLVKKVDEMTNKDKRHERQSLVIKLNMRDLLAQKQILYQDINEDGKYDAVNDNTMVSSQFGRVFSLSATFKF
ncbi:MAG TPA: TonB-dependent receptor [Flavobacteriales bacterium]|nr:TonB-dependent receptor [Flavobacteriales bacterium]